MCCFLFQVSGRVGFGGQVLLAYVCPERHSLMLWLLGLQHGCQLVFGRHRREYGHSELLARQRLLQGICSFFFYDVNLY
jgi:hypothetical protein